MIGFQRLLRIKIKDLSFYRVFNAIIRRIIHPFNLLIFFLPIGFNKKNKKKFKLLRDKYKNKRCFIIASGPSLKYINFKLLKNELTFAMNRGFMLKDQCNHMPSFLCCIDEKTQLKQFNSEYDDFNKIPTFYNWNQRNKFKKFKNRYFIKEGFSPKFLSNNGYIFGSGKSVTYTCIQLAFYMGFNEVYLIGKDHSYDTNAKPGKSVIVKENSNHFLKDYYKKNQIFDAPDYDGEEFAYSIAKKHFEKNKRKIFDATIKGKLEIFDKVDFESIFNEK